MTAIKDVAADYDVEYNGFRFGPLCRYHIRAQPQYDPAGRTIIYIHYTLNVLSWQYASSESSLSSAQDTLKDQLLEARGKLRISGVGFGEVDTHTTYEPIAWGPKPKSLIFHPLGGAVCWLLDWSCEFGVSECASRNLAHGGGSSPWVYFNYDTLYDTDEMGFGKRTINGVLSIPQHGRTRDVPDNPENYRDKIYVPCPRGYKQVHRAARANAAQNELHFSVVHQQIPHEPYPPGISKANVTFSTNGRSTDGGGLLGTWMFSLQADMETVPGFPKSWAMLKFYQIAFSRLSIMYEAIGAGRYGPTVLPVAADMTHQPYGRTSSFRMSWSIAGAVNGEFFNPNILYAPLTRELSDYDAWVNTPNNLGVSLQQLWTSGGQTDLRTLSPNIVDLCQATYSTTLNSTGRVYPLGEPSAFASPSDYFGCRHIAPENSWLAYEPVAQLYRTNNVTLNKRDVKASFEHLRAMTGFGQSPSQSFKSTTTDINSPFETTDSESVVGAPDQLLVFKGKAVRVHYPVSIPVIRSIEGVTLTLLKNVQESIPFTQLYGGCTMYAGRWIQLYRPQSFLAGRVISMPHPHITAYDAQGQQVNVN